MRRAGIGVTTVSITNEKSVRGAHGMTIEADALISDIITHGTAPSDTELLMLPGGEGHVLLDASNEAHALINDAVIRGGYIAAICAAPSILGKKQILSGKKATCYPGFEKYCYGAEMTGEKATVDGKIITGRGPGAAAEFGFAIVTLLKGEQTTAALKEAMQYND
jgi:4-methyl-5(b-hydroxyethyl)-thiazole monophosphate biosynthesis